MLLCLKDEFIAILIDFNSVIDCRQGVLRELNINHCTDYLNDFTCSQVEPPLIVRLQVRR